MYVACLLINAVYQVYPTRNKEYVNIYLSLDFVTGEKMTLKTETSNEAIGNKMPFSVLLCTYVY